ncbi:Uncharacterised protein [Mycobacteroides abscessus subsp. abscessus]|nr:Uncharacterised protein [Mycobacteroides abscessus subsp. abscessus]
MRTSAHARSSAAGSSVRLLRIVCTPDNPARSSRPFSLVTHSPRAASAAWAYSIAATASSPAHWVTRPCGA